MADPQGKGVVIKNVDMSDEMQVRSPDLAPVYSLNLFPN